MQCPVFLVILAVAVVTHSQRNSPKGLHFLGVGYNLLKGNPEGAEISKGGVDPGLFVTRKIFQLTWRSNKLSVNNKYRVPDQVSFAPRASCLTTNKKEVIPGPKSYQAKLNDEVKVSPGYSSILFSVAFTLSSRFKEIQRMTSNYHNVFYEKKHICNKGRARYQLELAPVKKFPVSQEFASAVCLLPTRYDSRVYFNFIEKWGTHIVVEVELGEKRIEHFKSSNTEFTKYAMENVAKSVAVSGSYMGYRTSLKVDIKAFKQSMSRGTKFGHNKVEFKSGGPNLPEPIGMKLVPIYEAFGDYFYTLINQSHSARCPSSSSLLKRRKMHVQRALNKYPRLKNAKKPVDPEVRIPVTWPQGTYGLPMPNAGCPRGTEVRWHSGTRFHDTEDSSPRNRWSSHYDLAGVKAANNMEQKFCIKTLARASEYSLDWPKGQYCILKKGSCPRGFRSGWIRWDDEDTHNGNRYSGQLPDGSYDGNTRIYYCCRSDGHATNAIILPTESPFVLLKSNTHLCQHVRGMYVRSEYFFWDCEDSSTRNAAGGFKPYSYVERNIDIHYCYYYR